MHTKSVYEQVDRRMYTWFRTAHEHMHEVDMGPKWSQEHMQWAKMIVANVPVPRLSFAELRKSHDFQHNHFINTKTQN